MKKQQQKLTKFRTHTHISLSLYLSIRRWNLYFDVPAPVSLSLSLSLYICKHGLDPDQTRMVFRQFKNVCMRWKVRKALMLCNVRLCHTKADAHDKFGFFGPCNKIDWLTQTLRFDILRNKAKTKDSCANTVQSLSLSLSLSFSLLLRPAIKVCSLDPEDRPASLIRGKHAYKVIIYSDFASDDHHTLKGTFQTCTFFQMHAMGGSRGGTRGLDPLKNHKNIGFPSDIDPDPLKITKLPSQHSMVGHYRQWRFADGQMVVHSVLSHYPLWQNVLDPRMHAVRLNRLDWN